MSSTPDDNNASEPTDSDDDQLDDQTREFIDAINHGSFDVQNVDVSTETTLHVVEATLLNVGQRNALKQYAKRYDFRETDFSPSRTDSGSGDTARVKYNRRLNADANAGPSRSTDDPVPVLPDAWSHQRGDGDDVIEHDDTSLTVSISKQYGRSMKHDDVKWHGTIRRGDGPGEPLTWGGAMSRRSIYAAAAKFAAGVANGGYRPSDHAPEDPWEWERPQWPAVLGYDDFGADPREWTRTKDSDV
jgi:hypothetical protein